jgi:hypothetical protein
MSAEIKSKNDRLRTPWNKGRLVGQKRPRRPKEVWAIRVRLQMLIVPCRDDSRLTPKSQCGEYSRLSLANARLCSPEDVTRSPTPEFDT